MSDYKNIHFVQLKINKDVSNVVNIILQTKDTKMLMQFQVPIDNSTFDRLYSAYQNQLFGVELEEKIIKLYSVAGNLIDYTQPTFEKESVSPIVTTNNIQPIAGTYSGWRKLIDNLNSYCSVRLSNYAGSIDTSYFKGAGWRYDD